jgi:hypothetical protein
VIRLSGSNHQPRLFTSIHQPAGGADCLLPVSMFRYDQLTGAATSSAEFPGESERLAPFWYLKFTGLTQNLGQL